MPRRIISRMNVSGLTLNSTSCVIWCVVPNIVFISLRFDNANFSRKIGLYKKATKLRFLLTSFLAQKATKKKIIK